MSRGEGTFEKEPPRFFARDLLFLNRRGQWFLPQGRITNPRLLQFLAEQYRYDPETKAMVVDNGPQRIFVTLEYTPWIYRVVPGEGHGDAPSFSLRTHTDRPVERIVEGYRDEEGNLLLVTEWGVGVVADTDLARLSRWIEEGEPPLLHLPEGRRLELLPMRREEVPQRFRFVPRLPEAPGRVSSGGGGRGDRSAP